MDSDEKGASRPRIVVTVPPRASRSPPAVEVRGGAAAFPAIPPPPPSLVARGGRHGSAAGLPDDENPFAAIDEATLDDVIDASLCGLVEDEP